MEALIFCEPHKRNCKEKSGLTIKKSQGPTIRITKTTICEIDLRIINRDIPEVIEDLILRHEGSEFKEEEVPGVSILKVGNKSLISCHYLRVF